MMRINHEAGRRRELATPSELEPGRFVRKLAWRDARMRLAKLILELMLSVEVLERVGAGKRFAGGVAQDRAVLRRGSEAGDVGHVAAAEALPGSAVVGQHDVGRDLEHDEAEGEDVRGLVVEAHEDLGADVFAVAFAVGAGGRGPGAGEAEVADLEHAFEGYQHVGGLEVEVDEAGGVDVFEALGCVSVSSLPG